MPQPSLETQIEFLSINLANQQTKCYRDHVTPLLALMNLPVGTVITREYSGVEQHEFWEIQMGDETFRGVDIVDLLSKLPQ
jgi:hypothetical protein